MSVRIIVDSSAEVTAETKKRILAVPVTICFGMQEYVDGVTITRRQFYEKLVESEELPTTSQPAPSAFEKTYQEVRAAGDSAVVITVTSKQSGTYQSAVIAAEEYPEIHVVDSGSAAIGAGILAEMAVKLADEGLNAEEIVQHLERERGNVRVIAMLDTLEYLKRGGRISRAVAFAGGLLSIKPILAIEDGAINLIGKARGSKQGNKALMQEIEKMGGINFDRPVMLGYTGLSDLMLRKFVEDSAEMWNGHRSELPALMVGSAIGTHAGPGAVAVAFVKAR